MKKEDLEKRIDELLVGVPSTNDYTYELFHGTLDILAILYGPSSPQLQNFIKDEEDIRKRYYDDPARSYRNNLCKGALANMKAALKGGLVESFQKTITGEVLTDFLQLAREVLQEEGDNSKNIASVLAASLFEDTIRRLAINNGIPHIARLQDVLIELKNKEILQGTQIGIANSYLNFRNNAMHAQWDKIERESIASVLGFVEQVLIRYFA